MSELFEEVEVEAYVYPTEDIEKVKRAMLNLIPDLEFEAFDRGGLYNPHRKDQGGQEGPQQAL